MAALKKAASVYRWPLEDQEELSDLRIMGDELSGPSWKDKLDA